MKQSINLGAYGWRYKHWSKSFYPEDLPADDDEDWRLAYYSNEFNAVLVPVDHWQAEPINDCEDWLDSVHSGFQFFVECHPAMFDVISLAELTRVLTILKPQLPALIYLDEDPSISDDIKRQFIALADSLGIEVFGLGDDSEKPSQANKIWRPDAQPSGQYASQQDLPKFSNFAFIEDELADLRRARAMVEQFVLSINDDADNAEATIIVNHPQLQASNLGKFRSILDIMGY